MTDQLKANCTELGKTFNFYYHAPENSDYSLESYNDILSFNSLEEFWVLDKFIKRDMIENGMFFIMVESVNPIWEDDHNINGGCISWKVDRKNSYKFWIDTVGHFLTQNLGRFTSKVNGVSISPKKNSSIIKLWFSEEIDIEKMTLPDSFMLANDKIIYKSHVQNIDKDKSKRVGVNNGQYPTRNTYNNHSYHNTNNTNNTHERGYDRSHHSGRVKDDQF
jgi:hypothetical protein